MKPTSIHSETARQLLKRAGLRVTPARIAVLKVVAQAGAPCTHLEISENLAKEGVEKSTVFRTLTSLAKAGLFRRIELGDHLWRFEMNLLPPEQNHDHHDDNQHPHFICVECGDISCLHDSEIKITLSADVEVENVLLRGRCPSCHET